MSHCRLSYGLTTDKGDVRETNQDAACDRLVKWGENDAGLFMVADGMGAKGEGERAAQIAVETVMEMVTEAISQDRVTVNFGELLTGAFQKANANIVRETPNSGTTLTAALLVGEMLYIAHVGDTLACRLANDKVVRLNIDHRLSSRLLQLGQITIDELRASEAMDDGIYLALGHSKVVTVDTVVEKLHSNSTILICTYDFLHLRWKDDLEPELQSILRDNAPQAACDRLVALARERGSADDITALVVRVEKEQPAT